MSPPNPAAPNEFVGPDTGVHEPVERVDARLRTANATLSGIRDDFTRHAAADEKSFDKVQGEIIRLQGTATTLSSQHTSVLIEIGEIKGSVGEIKGSVTSLLTLQQQATTAQMELAAAAREDKKTSNNTTEKLALARMEASTKIWKVVIPAILALALALVAGLVGHQVGSSGSPAATSK